MKKNNSRERQAPDGGPFSSQGGGMDRRTLLLMAAAGLLGLGGFALYRLTQIPGAFDMLLHGDRNEKAGVLRALATGEKLPADQKREDRTKQALREQRDRFEQRLERIKARNEGFVVAETKLLGQGFTLRHARKFFRNLRSYLETIYSSYPVKKDVPFQSLAEKINEFPEKRIFALICCCCGLPDDRGFNYMAISLFKRGYARLEGKTKAEAQYFIRVIQAIIYLRSAWYKNLLDATKNNPQKSEALQIVWNFLNTQDLPHDLIKDKTYYLRSLA